MKQCILAAGPSGAGKTTFANEFLPKEGRTMNFFNADLIAHGLSPFAPETVAFEASKLMIRRKEECCRRGESFGLETTLIGKLHLKEDLSMAATGLPCSPALLKFRIRGTGY